MAPSSSGSVAVGWPTLRGSKTVSREQAWDQDAPSVARLREAGCVFLGATTTPEFGWKGVTDSPLTGITRNPWDLSKTPGGSSGGSAAAWQQLCAAFAGHHGGGSIRIPANFSSIYVTFLGQVPAYPFRRWHGGPCGPMTRTVEDPP
jgi:aspartyl-tRNA(Asn)/glutamyl-tRNA(Gln) amidotransferase subunit A